MALIAGAAHDVVNRMAEEGDALIRGFNALVELMQNSPAEVHDYQIREFETALSDPSKGIIPKLDLAFQGGKFTYHYTDKHGVTEEKTKRISFFSYMARLNACNASAKLDSDYLRIKEKMPQARVR